MTNKSTIDKVNVILDRHAEECRSIIRELVNAGEFNTEIVTILGKQVETTNRRKSIINYDFENETRED